MFDIINLIIFYTILMLFNNSNGDAVNWRGSRKCHTGLAMGKTHAMVDTFENVEVFACEPYHHSKRNFDQK